MSAKKAGQKTLGEEKSFTSLFINEENSFKNKGWGLALAAIIAFSSL